MDTYFSNQLDKFQSSQASERDVAYASIGDYLSQGPWSPDKECCFENLVHQMKTEFDPAALESLLEAIIRVMSKGLPIRQESIEFTEATLQLYPPHLIGYVLEILALTHSLRFRPIIEGFLNHPDEQVREAATDALMEISGRQ